MDEPKRAKRERLENEVISLHRKGYTYEEISEILPVDKMIAHQIVVKRLGSKRLNKMNMSK